MFLCSSQLYSKWQLRIPDQRHQQFVSRAIDWLEWAVEEGCCDTRESCVSLEFDGEPEWLIGCHLEGQLAQFCLSREEVASVGFSADSPAWRDLTKAQLWHRLTGSPALDFAKFECDMHPATTLEKSKRFAQEAFDYLCRASGVLTLYMSDLGDSSEEVEEDSHALNIWHIAAEGSDFWEIDGERCIVTPPRINFDSLPTEVVHVRLHFASEGMHDPEFLFPDPKDVFYPDSQVICDFAYQGNVDIDAWVGRQHEAANDWYDHADDFDDMDDMDDADMAQLLGAMQG